jgi:hypothetical protein
MSRDVEQKSWDFEPAEFFLPDHDRNILGRISRQLNSVKGDANTPTLVYRKRRLDGGFQRLHHGLLHSWRHYRPIEFLILIVFSGMFLPSFVTSTTSEHVS